LNVALIVLDAVRADHVCCYGHSRLTTPNLDAFAAGATRYASVVAPGVWTFPSMTSMFTGLYPSQHGMNRADRSVPAQLRLLAERLHDAGYRTGGFSANPYVGRTYGFDRGFEVFGEFWGVSGNGGRAGVSGALNGVYQWLFPRVRRTVKRSQTLTRAYQRYQRRRVEAHDKGAAALVDAAVQWLSQGREGGEGGEGRRPFFLYAHLMEAHGPLAPPSRHAARFMDQPSIAAARQLNQDAMAYMAGANPLDQQQLQLLRDLYDASISYTDQALGRLLEALEMLAEDTVVVVTADHGNSFGEHGILDHFFSVHQTLAAVPLVVRHPDIPPGIINRPVGTIDITPTILETAGLDHSGLAGISLCSLTDPRPCLVTEFLDPPLERFERFHRFDPVAFGRELRALRRGDHKYIWSSDGREELYDLGRDPGETINLVDTQPTLLAELRNLHDDWRLETSAGMTTAKDPATANGTSNDLEVEEEVASTLRALGYLD
jgi:arylsulfatase A-like enzyme